MGRSDFIQIVLAMWVQLIKYAYCIETVGEVNVSFGGVRLYPSEYRVIQKDRLF